MLSSSLRLTDTVRSVVQLLLRRDAEAIASGHGGAGGESDRRRLAKEPLLPLLPPLFTLQPCPCLLCHSIERARDEEEGEDMANWSDVELLALLRHHVLVQDLMRLGASQVDAACMANGPSPDDDDVGNTFDYGVNDWRPFPRGSSSTAVAAAEDVEGDDDDDNDDDFVIVVVDETSSVEEVPLPLPRPPQSPRRRSSRRKRSMNDGGKVCLCCGCCDYSDEVSRHYPRQRRELCGNRGGGGGGGGKKAKHRRLVGGREGK